MAKSDGWRMRDVREMIDQIEMEGVGRGARRCGIRSVERGCVEGTLGAKGNIPSGYIVS